MLGHVLNRHVLRQLQGISRKGTGVRKARVGKSQRRLTNAAATTTTDTLNVKINKYTFGTYRNRFEPPPLCSSHQYLSAFANRAVKLFSLVTNREGDLFPFILRPHIIIANKTKTAVQNNRGHTSPPIIGNIRQFPFGVVCPFFQVKSTL